MSSGSGSATRVAGARALGWEGAAAVVGLEVPQIWSLDGLENLSDGALRPGAAYSRIIDHLFPGTIRKDIMAGVCTAEGRS